MLMTKPEGNWHLVTLLLDSRCQSTGERIPAPSSPRGPPSVTSAFTQCPPRGILWLNMPGPAEPFTPLLCKELSAQPLLLQSLRGILVYTRWLYTNASRGWHRTTAPTEPTGASRGELEAPTACSVVDREQDTQGGLAMFPDVCPEEHCSWQRCLVTNWILWSSKFGEDCALSLPLGVSWCTLALKEVSPAAESPVIR